jgi:hypothetical protein
MIGPPMSAKRFKHRRPVRQGSDALPPESHLAETLTIAWTVSVTGLLIADLMFLGASLFVRANPDAQALQMLAGILLLLAAGIGAASLGLLAIVWQKRRLKPPLGYTAFAALVAAAPIATLVAKLLEL